MNKNDSSVLVVGAGVAGLAAACALRLQGCRVTVLEQAAAPQMPSGDLALRVSAFSPASIEFLESLGAWPAGSPRVRPYPFMDIWTDGEFDRVQFSATELGLTSLGAIAENQLIQAQLWERALELSVELVAEKSWRHFSQNGTGVKLGLDDGSELEADWLVVADGGNSALRELLNIRQSGWGYEQKAIVCAVQWKAGAPENRIESTAAQRFMKTGPLALLPLPGNQSSLVWSLDNDAFDKVMALPDAEFVTCLQAAVADGVGATIESTGPRVSFPLRLAQSSSYLAGRCTLVGDAAHSVHPLAGQGLNLGVLDARDLALAFTKGHVSEGELARWHRKRKATAAEMMLLTDGLYRVYRLARGRKEGASSFLKYAGENAFRGMLSAGMAAVGASSLLRQQLARLAVGSDQ